MTSTWCVLRMAGPRTLSVVRSLRAIGFDVWTPTGMQRRKRPRSNKYRDEPDALLKTFAFARYDDAPQLSAIAHSPAHDLPPFTLLMHRDMYGKVADRELDELRRYEVDQAEEWLAMLAEAERLRLEALRKKKNRKRSTGRTNAARAYVLGQTVKVAACGFQGLTGKVVENRRNGEMVIVFDGLSMELTVEACDLRPVQVQEA